MTVELCAPPAIATTTVDGLRVAIVGDRCAPRQVLIFMGLKACVEPFELQRFALLARSWDAALTVVDAPGCGYSGARLTGRERRALRRGDFTDVARRMVAAAQEVNHRLRRGPVLVAGYSMGASLAAAAAADPGRLRVAAMILVEPVGVRRWNLLSLLRAVRIEDRTIDGYLAHNDGLTGVVQPADRRGEAPPRSRLDLAHLGFGLSRGRLPDDLQRASRIQEFPLQVVHGSASRLSRVADASWLVRRCRRAGIDVHDITVAGHHALWHSLPHVAGLARCTRLQWPG